MKRILTLLVALALPLTLLAQTSQEDYVRRYNNLIGHVGPAGVGVETLLDRWAEEYPDDIQQLLARFSFWFTKAQTTNVIQLPQDRYLGREPLLPMTDSLGRKSNFFEDTVYDDEMFGQALEAVDKAVALEPKRLDLRLLRIDALTAYEKGSPDMALSALKSLAGPFGGVKFIPTGGVGPANLAEFAAAPQVHAVGGSWVLGIGIHGGLIALWCALILDENIRGLIFIRRWKSRRWTTKSLV